MHGSKDFVVFRGFDYQEEFDTHVLNLINQVLQFNLEFSPVISGRWADLELSHYPEDYKSIRNTHVILFACPTSDRLLLEMQDMITACKWQFGAKTLTLGMSYLRYRRQDRMDNADKEYEITRLRWFMRDLKHWGVDRLVLCEPHSVLHTKRYCREFHLPLVMADPTELFAEAINPLLQTIGRENFVAYAPDFGSVARAMAFARATGTSVVALPKKRIYGDTVELDLRFDASVFLHKIRQVYGTEVPVSCTLADVRGRYVIVCEDEISTGSTAIGTAYKLRAAGAVGVYFIATHPVCTPGWSDKLVLHKVNPPFDSIWFGNTRPRGEEGGDRESTRGKIHTVDIAPVFARAMIAAIQKVVKRHR